MAKDTSSGSKKVKISGKEVMLKNKSYFKTSMGDEAGCAPKKGVITSKIKGKVYFIGWSMDVKVEGKNVVRHLDMTTHNHGSGPNTPPTLYADRMAMADIPGCEGEKEAVKNACGENGENFSCPDKKPLDDAKAKRADAKKQFGKGSAQHNAAKAGVDAEIDNLATENKADDCRKKMRCLLSPYDNDTCCPGQTPHHLVEAGSFHDEGRGGMISKKNIKRVKFVRSLTAPTQVVEESTGEAGKVPSRPVFGAEKYDQGAAPCVCCEGESQNQGTHKQMHQAQARRAADAQGVANPNPFFPLTTAKGEPAKMQTLSSAITSGVESLNEVFPESNCDPGCTEAQLNEYHYKKAKMNPELPIKAVNGQGKAIPAD
jgi:hypothetical protein